MSHIEQIPPYLTWKIRHQAMYPNLEFEKAVLPNDDDGVHFGLFNDNKLISVISVFRVAQSLQFRKFATLSEYQHQGHGSELLTYVIQYAKDSDCTVIWCNARKTASGFYQKLGFHETEKTSSANGIDYVLMERLFPENLIQ